MHKIILMLLLALSLQGFVDIAKYGHQKSSGKCLYLKENSIKYALRASQMENYQKAQQYKDLADNLYDQNARCMKGDKQRVYGSPSQFKN